MHNNLKHICLLLLMLLSFGELVNAQFTNLTEQQKEYFQLEEEWHRHEDNIGIAKKLYAYRAKYGGDPNIDYMIADSLCRVPQTVQDGYNVLRDMFDAYNLDAKSRSMVKARIDSVTIRPRANGMVMVSRGELYFEKQSNGWVAKVSFALAGRGRERNSLSNIIQKGSLLQLTTYLKSRRFAKDYPDKLDRQDLFTSTLSLVAKRKDKEGVKILSFLINRGADFNSNVGSAAFDIIVSEGNPQMLDVLLLKGFNLTKMDFDGLNFGEGGLLLAVRRKDYNGLLTVRILQKNHVNLNARYINGDTALLTAASYGSFLINQYLIDNGADINTDNGGETALSHAIGRKDIDGMLIVNYLLKKGAVLKGIVGAKALAVAAMSGNIDGIKTLLNAGVDINAVDAERRTALMEASEYGVARSVRFLLSNGAKIDMKDSEGRTAYDIAEENYYHDIARMIKEASYTK